MHTLISWPVTVGGTVDVTVDGSTETLTYPSGDYAGVKYTVGFPGVPASDSVSGVFATMLATHSKITSVAALYDYTPVSGTALPATVYTITYASGTSGTITWGVGAGALDPRLVGWDGTYSVGFTTALINPLNSAGYWRPGVGADNVMDLRSTEVVGSQSVAASAATASAYHTRVLGEVEKGALVYDAVDDAYIRLYRAQDGDSLYATSAGRTVGDEHNVLYNLVVAAANNSTMTVWRDETEQFTCKVSTPWSIEAMTTSIGGSGTRYSVTIHHTVVV